MATNDRAAEALLYPRILEDILYQLPPHQVFVCQRVSPFWKEIITESILLQRKLYLKPVKQSEEWTALVLDPPNPPSKRADVIEAVQPADLEERRNHCAAIVGTLNPLLHHTFDYDLRSKVYKSSCRAVESLMAAIDDGGTCCEFDRVLSLANSEPSCLQMFLTQPPTKEIVISIVKEHPSSCFIYPKWSVMNEDGLRVKDMLQAVKRMAPCFRQVCHVSLKICDFLTVEENNQRRAINQGIEQFAKLESKIGRTKALELVTRSHRDAKGSRQLLKRDNLDKIVAMGMVDEIIEGASIRGTLRRCDAMNRPRVQPSDWLNPPTRGKKRRASDDEATLILDLPSSGKFHRNDQQQENEIKEQLLRLCGYPGAHETNAPL